MEEATFDYVPLELISWAKAKAFQHLNCTAKIKSAAVRTWGKPHQWYNADDIRLANSMLLGLLIQEVWFSTQHYFTNHQHWWEYVVVSCRFTSLFGTNGHLSHKVIWSKTVQSIDEVNDVQMMTWGWDNRVWWVFKTSPDETRFFLFKSGSVILGA